jgi:hypothetical protein
VQTSATRCRTRCRQPTWRRTESRSRGRLELRRRYTRTHHVYTGVPRQAHVRAVPMKVIIQLPSESCALDALSRVVKPADISSRLREPAATLVGQVDTSTISIRRNRTTFSGWATVVFQGRFATSEKGAILEGCIEATPLLRGLKLIALGAWSFAVAATVSSSFELSYWTGLLIGCAASVLVWTASRLAQYVEERDLELRLRSIVDVVCLRHACVTRSNAGSKLGSRPTAPWPGAAARRECGCGDYLLERLSPANIPASKACCSGALASSSNS